MIYTWLITIWSRWSRCLPDFYYNTLQLTYSYFYWYISLEPTRASSPLSRGISHLRVATRIFISFLGLARMHTWLQGSSVKFSSLSAAPRTMLILALICCFYCLARKCYRSRSVIVLYGMTIFLSSSRLLWSRDRVINILCFFRIRSSLLPRQAGWNSCPPSWRNSSLSPASSSISRVTSCILLACCRIESTA